MSGYLPPSKTHDGEIIMAEPSPALSGGQQPAGLDLLSKEQQTPPSSNVISEFASGVWDGAIAKKAQGVGQLFGADIKTPEVKRTGLAQIAHTAGEVTGDLADFVIMSKFAGKAIAKFAPEIAATGKVGEFVALNPVGRSMAVGGTVGLINGAVLTPTKEGESGWNRVGKGFTDMATFATLGGVAAKFQPLAETGFVGRLKANSISGAAAGVVNSELDGLTHGRQVGVGEMALNTAGWMAGNVLFGEAINGAGKLGNKFFPNLNLGDNTVGKISGAKPEDLAALRQQLAGMKADMAKGAGGEPIDQTRGATSLRTMRMAVAPDQAAAHVDGEVKGANAGADAEVLARGTNPGEHTETTLRDPAAKDNNDALTTKVDIEKEPPKDGEVAEVKDRTKGSVMLEKGETLSMREMFKQNPEEAEKILNEYMTKLQKAFPLEGEIEDASVYKEYLTKPGGTWDMVVLRDKAQNIMGGIQYQIIDVNGKAINKAAWGEHIWLDEQARNGKNFYTLLGIAKENIIKNGGEIVFMEFNNPDKMSVEQMLADEAAGLSAKDREKIWGRTGIHVLVDSKGQVLEYGQPAMSDEDPPVMFLSLGFISTKPLAGTTLPKEDYLKLLQAAHRTIPSVDIETDPTVKWYTDAVNATGEDKFTFVPLNALAVAREAGQRAAQEAMQRETAKSIAKVMQSGDLKDAIAKLVADNKATPEALQALVEQVLLQNALKSAHGGK